jgi:ParB family transcriptional regulator, chromosome partitioning protein
VNRRGGLGRGLAALIPPGDDQRATLVEVPVAAVIPNHRQPREVFDEEEIEGLATSISDMGLLQPIVVRPLDESRYELIAGERRLRASKLAGLETLPAVVRHTDDADLLKEALVENIHRVQLNPLEEAAAYQQLLDEFGFTQEELAAKLGRSRPAIGNALRLLNLPPGVQRRVAAGVLSAGHAKALLAVPDADAQQRLADSIVAEGLSVRATEELVRLRLVEEEEKKAPPARRRTKKVSAPGLLELQDDLSDALMARVKITMGARKGRLQVEFGSVDDLERIIGVIARGLENGLPDRELLEPENLEGLETIAAPEDQETTAEQDAAPGPGGPEQDATPGPGGPEPDTTAGAPADAGRPAPPLEDQAGLLSDSVNAPATTDHDAESIDALDAADLDGIDLEQLDELTRPDN